MAKLPEDRLERFIIENRSELDTAQPPDEIWENVSDLMHKGKKTRSLTPFEWVWRVAAVFFFGLTLYLVVDKINTGDNVTASEILTEDAYKNFLTAEEYYSDIIQIKQNEVSNNLSRENPLNVDFTKDIAELDSVYSLLKKEYELNNDQIVMDAMISNLRLRVEMLDKQLDIIEDLNKIETKKDEGITI